jgi:hypothetical protein
MCPVPHNKGKFPNVANLWSKPVKKMRQGASKVAFTVAPDENASIPEIAYRVPKKFLKAPNGCVSTQYQRERLYEALFPSSYVKIRLWKDERAPADDLYGGYRAEANYYGLVKHYGPFTDFILEQKSAWADPNRPVCQISLPYLFFTDDPEVWLDVVPTDRNIGKNLPISTVGGFMPIHTWSRGLSWAFEWMDTSVTEFTLNEDTVMFNILFSKPVKIEYKEWNDTFHRHWNRIMQVGMVRRNTNELYPEALKRRDKKILKSKWFSLLKK